MTSSSRRLWETLLRVNFKYRKTDGKGWLAIRYSVMEKGKEFFAEKNIRVAPAFYDSLVARIKIMTGIEVGNTRHDRRFKELLELTVNRKNVPVDVTITGRGAAHKEADKSPFLSASVAAKRTDGIGVAT